MKITLLSATFFLIFIPLAIRAQDQDRDIEKDMEALKVAAGIAVNQELLSREESKQALELIEQGSMLTAVELLNFIYGINYNKEVEKKTKLRESEYSALKYIKGSLGLKKLREYAGNIIATGLLGNRAAQRLLAYADSPRVNHRLHLLELAPWLLHVEERMGKPALNDLAGKLLERNVASDSSYMLLVQDIEAGNVSKIIDVIPYCQRAMVFDSRNYPGNPMERHTQLFYQAARLLNIPLTDLYMRMEKQNSGGEWFVASFKVHGKEYVYKNLHAPRGGRQLDSDIMAVLGEVLPKDTRFYLVLDCDFAYPDVSINTYRFGLIALSVAQTEAFSFISAKKNTKIGYAELFPNRTF